MDQPLPTITEEPSPWGVLGSATTHGAYYVSLAVPSIASTDTKPAAAASVAQLERSLPAAVRAEGEWVSRHGGEHPVFRDPVSALGAYGVLLGAARQAAPDDLERVAAIDAIE
jgi:hypothetical protein